MARMISRQEAADLLNVSGQTISNWVEKGVLNAHYSCDGRNTMLIDRRSIEKYFDTLESLAFMEKRISLQRKTLKEESDALENDLKDMSEARYLFGRGMPEFYLRDIFNCVLYVAGDELLKEREREILRQLMSGKTLEDVAGYYVLSRSRIIQIVIKAIHKISTMKSWPRVHDEYKRIRDENHRITVLLERQRNRIRALERQSGQAAKTDGGETGVPGYSRRGLAEVLGRRLDHENLSARSKSCLRSADIETVGQLVRYKKADLLKLRHFGKKSVAELEEYLDRFHLSFGMDDDRLMDAEVDYLLKEDEKQREGI